MRSVVSLALLLFAGMLCADEVVRTDGQRVEGRLILDSAGKLRFTPAGKDAPLAPDSIQDIRFPAADVPPFLIGTPHRVELANEQHVTGELLRVDEDSVHLRTAWAEDLKLPRRAVIAVTQPYGVTTIFHEDFDTDPIRMQLASSPPLDDKQHTSGGRGLALNAIGQSALYTLPAPLNAGRIGLHFRETGQASGARWLVEAEFADGSTSRTIGVVLAGEGDAYVVESDVPSGDTRRIAHSTGWHRLSIRFRRDYLLVGVDDRLLFESGKKGPGAPLKQVRLACKKRAAVDSPRGVLHFDDLTLAKTLEPVAHAAGDTTQDELWLASGDQLFGKIDRADRRHIILRAGSVTREIAWADLRGIYFKLEAAAPRTADSVPVRIQFRSGLGSEPDKLDGILEALSDQTLTLRHTVLGRVKLDRARLVRLRPLASAKLR
jgi:hypothetical protein